MLDLEEFRKRPFSELVTFAQSLNIESPERYLRDELLNKILLEEIKQDGVIFAGGILEVLEDGYGFLRSAKNNYLPGEEDIYISPSQIKKFNLRDGMEIRGRIRPPKGNENYFALLKVESVNGGPPENAFRLTFFDDLTPLYPLEMIDLERDPNDASTRIMNLFTPIGKGQRGLIVSPPKAGKTMLLQRIANSITANHPEVELIVLLIDERPEEVTDMERSVNADVISSTFDEAAERHVEVAKMVIERAKRLVEYKRDVAILLDSITRLARAYNSIAPHSGRILSGGIDSNALQHPKRFFGAARNIEEGGSLSILATALIDTGSRMDDVIFEEFKGTGNMEIILDRNLSNRRIYPAFDVNRSGTRKEELLFDEATLQRIWLLRKIFSDMNSVEAMQFLKDKILATKTNADFFKTMNE